MKIAIYILAGFAFGGFLALNVRKALHMFQLNSYKPATHMRWLKRNLGSLIPGVVLAIAAVVGGLLENPLLAAFLVGAVLLRRFCKKSFAPGGWISRGALLALLLYALVTGVEMGLIDPERYLPVARRGIASLRESGENWAADILEEGVAAL